MSEVPLDFGQIDRYVVEVAAELPPGGPQHVLIVVGGALMAWHGLRDTTTDVDSVRRIDDELREAVERVAERRGLAPRWVNDSAAGYLPATLREDECERILDEPQLLVLGAPLEQVFLMKLYSTRATDSDDLGTLWPACGFESPEHAVERFYEAYPHAPVDEFLADWVRDNVT